MPTMTTIQLLTQEAGNTDPLTDNTYGLPFNGYGGVACGTINDYKNFAYICRINQNKYGYVNINREKVDGRKVKKFKINDMRELLEFRGVKLGDRGVVPLEENKPVKKKIVRLIIKKKLGGL